MWMGGPSERHDRRRALRALERLAVSNLFHRPFDTSRRHLIGFVSMQRMGW